MRSLILLALAFSSTALAGPQEPYRLPPDPLVDLAMAEPSPGTSLSPDARWMLLSGRDAMPPLAEVTRPMLRLAGRRLDPAAHASFQTRFTRRLTLRPLVGSNEVALPLPEGARVSWTSWSPDSATIAYVLESDQGSQLWVVSTSEPTSPRLLTDALTTIPGRPSWTADSQSMLVHLWPDDGLEAPVRDAAPAGPKVLETDGSATPLRTYQDLLRDADDAELWAYHSRSELAMLTLDGAEPEVIAKGLFAMADLSPNGRYLLLAHFTEPFSFTMPAWRFGRRVSLVDLVDKSTFLPSWNLPLTTAVPIGGVATGPRNFQWAASHPASLVWAEALDGGDPKVEVSHRDRWMMIQAPFPSINNEPGGTRWPAQELARTEHRAQGLSWFEDPSMVLVSEYDRDRRWVRTSVRHWGTDAPPQVLEDRSTRDAYGDPGSPMMELGPLGRPVVQVEENWMLRSGRGASDEGDLPFLDRQHLVTGEVERVWRSAAGSYESVLHVNRVVQPEGASLLRFITRHEDPSSPPNLRLREQGSDEFLQITEFPDPQPALRGVTKRIVRYERADGVPLSATLYLPEGHTPGERLPMLVWGYPLEYGDSGTAGQVRGSAARFTRLGGTSHLFLATLGYAVLDGATMPVVGDAETMNDTFVEQLVASAEAAVKFAVDEGVADPERLVVAGHSYGAFMTANLLAHSDLFAAGIARSGAYNRTLTPFGFQSERRNLWEATQTYVKVSPFLAADRIDEPLLLIHGMLDNNSGTFPLQSERLYQAIQGLGGSARLVMLPGEGHGYRAQESVLHVLAEMVSWMEAHVGSPGSDFPVLREGPVPVEAGAPVSDKPGK